AEMNDNDKGGAGLIRKGLEEGLQGLDAAGRGADPHDDRLGGAAGGIVPAVRFAMIGHVAPPRSKPSNRLLAPQARTLAPLRDAGTSFARHCSVCGPRWSRADVQWRYFGDWDLCGRCQCVAVSGL